MRRIVLLVLMCFLVGCEGSDTLAVRGDSTAIASRSGLAKIFNFAPSWDWKRWWVMVAADLGRKPFNDGVGGQDIRTMRDKMIADQKHRMITTIIYDRRNAGEEPLQYIADLKDAIATLTTDHFLVMPQVPQSHRLPESDEQRAAMAEIDRQVLLLWPRNTFSPEERTAFLAELDADDTRIDGLHRNENGQLIEARYIGGWIKQRGW